MNPVSTPGIDPIHEVIRSLLADARRVLITSHIRPDGDAVGSVLGLGLALMAQGKVVHMVLADGVPHSFRHLAGSAAVHRSAPAEELHTYDLCVTVDSADLQRIGGVLNGRSPDLNIDHHVTNAEFGKVNLVLPDRAATCEILAEFMPVWGLDFDLSVSSALLTGIVTDTIGFRTSNVRPQSLMLAAQMMELGANLPELYTRALITKSFEAARYWGQGLSQLQREEVPATAEPGDNGKDAENRVIVWTQLTLQDRMTAAYHGNDDADLVNLLSSIECDLAVIFVEQKNGHVKVSWRARPGFDVSKIALKFGGGGHPAAAGADIAGTLADVQEQVLAATRAVLAGQENQARVGEIKKGNE